MSKKDKTYYVPKSTKLKEMAELFALEFGHKKGTKAFDKYISEFLDEALYNSILPGGAEPYAKNPKVSDSTFDQDLDFFFGSENIIKKSLGARGLKDLGVDKTRQLRGILTQLTHLYLETIQGVSVKAQYDSNGDVIPSDFQFPKGAESDDERIKDVIEFRYKRIFFLMAFVCAVRPVFEISKEETEKAFSKMAMDADSVASLKSKETRKNFVSTVFKFFSKKFGKISLLD